MPEYTYTLKITGTLQAKNEEQACEKAERLLLLVDTVKLPKWAGDVELETEVEEA